MKLQGVEFGTCLSELSHVCRQTHTHTGCVLLQVSALSARKYWPFVAKTLAVKHIQDEQTSVHAPAPLDFILFPTLSRREDDHCCGWWVSGHWTHFNSAPLDKQANHDLSVFVFFLTQPFNLSKDFKSQRGYPCYDKGLIKRWLD